jgi:hypothetical protein
MTDIDEQNDIQINNKSNSTLHNAILHNAILHNATLHNATIHDATLHDATLQNATPHNATQHNDCFVILSVLRTECHLFSVSFILCVTYAECHK